jgi:uridylate kinase
MRDESKQRYVISVGGSLIVPANGIDTSFLQKFRAFIRKQLELHPNRQFFLVAGGGQTARNYQTAGREVVGHELPDDDLDWLGIHSSRLNGHLLRTVFRDMAHPVIIKDFDIIRKVTEPVIVGAGWKPGWSTDYIATLFAEDYHVKTVINLSNITQVFDKDPAKFTDAKPKDHMNWPEFRAMVGDKWSPGLNAPFDPIAAKRADELGLTVAVMNGKDIDNLENYLEEKPFIGTVIDSALARLAEQIAR